MDFSTKLNETKPKSIDIPIIKIEYGIYARDKDVILTNGKRTIKFRFTQRNLISADNFVFNSFRFVSLGFLVDCIELYGITLVYNVHKQHQRNGMSRTHSGINVSPKGIIPKD